MTKLTFKEKRNLWWSKRNKFQKFWITTFLVIIGLTVLIYGINEINYLKRTANSTELIYSEDGSYGTYDNGDSVYISKIKNSFVVKVQGIRGQTVTLHEKVSPDNLIDKDDETTKTVHLGWGEKNQITNFKIDLKKYARFGGTSKNVWLVVHSRNKKHTAKINVDTTLLNLPLSEDKKDSFVKDIAEHNSKIIAPDMIGSKSGHNYVPYMFNLRNNVQVTKDEEDSTDSDDFLDQFTGSNTEVEAKEYTAEMYLLDSWLTLKTFSEKANLESYNPDKDVDAEENMANAQKTLDEDINEYKKEYINDYKYVTGIVHEKQNGDYVLDDKVYWEN